jgi:hypothetical protein
LHSIKVCSPLAPPPRAAAHRQNILASALNLLSTQPDLSSQAAADALAAVALLQGQDTAAALQAFLAARKQWVQQQLEQAAASPAGGQQAAGAVLTQLAQSVQSCVAQVGELFTAQRAPGSSNGDGDGSLLQQAAQEDESDASELFFGSTAAEGSNSPEAAQWRQQAAAFYEQLAPLQREQVSRGCGVVGCSRNLAHAQHTSSTACTSSTVAHVVVGGATLSCV